MFAQRGLIRDESCGAKSGALKFMDALEHPDERAISSIMTDDFEFELMGPPPGVTPVGARRLSLETSRRLLKTAFPNGLNLKIKTVIDEGSQVAIQAQSNTSAAEGKKYANRYHLYFLFRAKKIAQARECNHPNHL